MFGETRFLPAKYKQDGIVCQHLFAQHIFLLNCRQDESPLKACLKDFVAVHADPVTSKITEREIEKANTTSDRNPIVYPLLWGAYNSPSQPSLGKNDVNNFLADMGQPDGCLIVSCFREEIRDELLNIQSIYSGVENARSISIVDVAMRIVDSPLEPSTIDFDKIRSLALEKQALLVSGFFTNKPPIR